MQPQLPPLPLPRGSQWGLFYAFNKKQWFITSTELRTLRGARVIKDSGSLPVHRAEITLRSGLRTEQKSRFAARGAEILKKGFTDVLK
jgi:hypothetical protein